MSAKAESGSGRGCGGAVGPPDHVPEISERLLETIRWLDENPQALAGYGGKWVVAAGRRICAAADGPLQAIREAERAGASQEDMAVEYVEDVPHVYVVAGHS